MFEALRSTGTQIRYANAQDDFIQRHRARAVQSIAYPPDYLRSMPLDYRIQGLHVVYSRSTSCSSNIQQPAPAPVDAESTRHGCCDTLVVRLVYIHMVNSCFRARLGKSGERMINADSGLKIDRQ